MSDVNGIPNYGFQGGQTGPIGGIPNQTPAWSADQINRGMYGSYHPGMAQALLNQGFNQFGQQTDYYSSLGAAYGRQTGGFNAPQSTDGMDPGMYGAQPTFDDRWSGMPAGDGLPNFEERWAATQQNAPGFNERWGGMPTYQGQTAVDAVSGGWGGTPTTGTAYPPTGGYDPLDPSSTPTPQFVNNGPSGTPWWQQTTNPAMDDALARFRAGRGWTIGQQVGGDPSLAQNINQSMYDIGNATPPGMAEHADYMRQYGLNLGRADHFSDQTQYSGPDGGFGPNPAGSLGYMDQFGNYGSRNEQWGAQPFQDRWGALPNGGINAGQPNMYYTGSQYQGGPMPPGFAPMYSVDNPNGALPLGGYRPPQETGNWGG
jgi:hypothetical protein